ncbi:carbonic anhydrase [Cellulomonas carbonis]|uniref:Carbonic anhydrase n=1 Tax=Cellulomonas carbonis T26 TaxID=947969 RepID=A0A0A0BVN2_9CELL|nr:carbonic anhydrase [Cellulomonas carbonis]KGM12458.1 carbonic anhydrase [Cellulomonas carbonis T26]MDT0165247.1 carbonic anhydrase [Actinotalea sp. AC32]GGC15455.1 carbonic anhydrase [Cellulomonas carbonis]
MTTPAQAWADLMQGNDRFVRGEMQHPSQDAQRRAEVSAGQNPFAVVFGCSDSRAAAEIIFDRGLGDLFVVRTAGHVVDTTVIGSIEFGVDVLGASLVVVLGHDSCGAVGAAARALRTGEVPSGFVRAVVDRVIPSVVHLPRGAEGDLAADEDAQGGGLSPEPAVLGREHVRHTVRMLQSYSAGVRDAVAEGRCAVVGAEYALAEGRVRLVEVAGDIG